MDSLVEGAAVEDSGVVDDCNKNAFVFHKIWYYKYIDK